MRVNSLETGSYLDKGTGGVCAEGGCLRGGEVWRLWEGQGRSGLSLVLVFLLRGGVGEGQDDEAAAGQVREEAAGGSARNEGRGVGHGASRESSSLNLRLRDDLVRRRTQIGFRPFPH
jgi:hypothetical protein